MLASRYVLEQVMGFGASATTWQATDQVSGRVVAIKLLDEARWSETLRDEFSRLKGLHHPNLAQVHDLGVERLGDESLPFLVVERVDGPTLDVFARRHGADATLSAFADALEGLSFLHALGIRHGDFKSQNVLVAADGRGVLIDLGCARPLDAPPDGRLRGTPAFMAPELLRGDAGDRRSDIYSAGATLRALFDSEGPAPAVVGRLVERATATEPSARPADARELLEALGRSGHVFAPPGGRSPRLVGREAELRRFEAELDALLQGRSGARVLALVGRDGVGKSRLLQEMKWLAQLRCRVVVGEASQPNALVGMLGRALGSPEARGLDALVSCHEQLSRGPPVLAILDDLDLCTDEAREATAALLRLLEPGAALMLLLSSSAPVPEVETLELTPLDLSAVGAWAQMAGLSPELVPPLQRVTGGFPVDLERVLGRLVSGQLAESELATPGHSSSATCFPSSIRGDPASALLAATGGSLSIRRLEQLALDPEPLLALQSLGLVRHRRGALTLTRPADLQALAQVVGEDALTRAHSRLADHLAKRPADESPAARSLRASRRLLQLAGAGRRREAQQLLLAERSAHELAPEGWRRAVVALDVVPSAHEPELSLAAAAIFATRGALDDALSLLARLLRRRPPAPWSGRCRSAIGSALLLRGDARRAARYLEQALPELDSGHASRALDQLARARVQLGDYAGAQRHARRGLPGAQGDAALRGALNETLGVACMYLGQLDEARVCLDRAARQASSPRSRVRVSSYRGITEFRAGELDAAITHYRLALELAERHALADQLASATLNLATALQQRGDWGGALRRYERALRLAVALGKRGTQLTVRHNLANLWLMVGLVERAEHTSVEVLEDARRQGRVYFEGAARGLLAECASRRADWPRARRLYAEARASFAEQGANREQAEMCLGLYAVASRSGDAAEAERWAAAAEEKIASADADDLATRLMLQRGREQVAAS
ncbi:MAG: protein kinase, partial [Deltaproteobacteria bacterium]|nr:protein kinase [Deltaproteobacteria bacterium]